MSDLLEQAVARYSGFTIPDPLVACEDCGEHAAFYRMDGDPPRFFCGPCGPKHSIFRLPMPPGDIRQRAADEALGLLPAAPTAITNELHRLEREDG